MSGRFSIQRFTFHRSLFHVFSMVSQCVTLVAMCFALVNITSGMSKVSDDDFEAVALLEARVRRPVAAVKEQKACSFVCDSCPCSKDSDRPQISVALHQEKRTNSNSHAPNQDFETAQAASGQIFEDFAQVRACMRLLVYFGLIAFTKWIWRRHSQHEIDSGGELCSSLSLALKAGDLDLCRKLVDDGAPLQTMDAWECSSLHIAAQHGCVGTLELLLSQEVLVNACDAADETPLHLAARAGRIAVCEKLIAHGASVNAVNMHNQTPLMLAAQEGNAALCRSLKSCGASVEDIEVVPLEFRCCLVETHYSPGSVACS